MHTDSSLTKHEHRFDQKNSSLGHKVALKKLTYINTNHVLTLILSFSGEIRHCLRLLVYGMK